jgi:hypothetical protein
MPLQKQPVSLNFAQGLDLKTDPYQVQIGKFLTLQNSIFDKANRLTKRNGFANITTISQGLNIILNNTTLTTLNDNLLATGSNLYTFNQDTNQWLDKGIIQPVSLSVLPLVRISTSQSGPDAIVAPNGLVCTVYMDNGQGFYQISDSVTGQQIVGRTSLIAAATNPRTFLFAQWFIVTYAVTSGGTQLQYVAIPYQNPTSPLAASTLATTMQSATAGYDAYSTPAGLYYAWSKSSTEVDIAVLTQSNIALAQTPTTFALSGSHTANLMSVTIDPTGLSGHTLVWTTFWDGTNVWTASFSQALTPQLTPTQIASSVALNTITSVASNSTLSVFAEVKVTYSYDSNIQTDYIASQTVQFGGSHTTLTPIVRSLGLASKAFTAPSGTTYMLAAYDNRSISPAMSVSNQPSYFLIDSTGSVYMRLAYSNGGGYETSQVLPSVSVTNGVYQVPYSIKDFLASVNKGTNLPSGTPSAAIYTQTGVNLTSFSINNSGQYSSEIASALHLTGGQLWEYDGVKPVEHGFHVYPENIETARFGSGGSMGGGTANNVYYYVFTYEWTDNVGNLHRSAPSIPVIADLSGGSYNANTNQVAVYVPTLRITDKISPNPVRIVGYRWSVGQQVYYQVTSLTSPIINDPTMDYIEFLDTQSDASILGNVLLYTTGGVIENIAAPASVHSCLYKSRLFLIDAEDPNVLWFSKQVIETTPVEMSDLLTLFVPPTTGAQGSTGPMTALSAMDDKLIIFKKDAIYYVTGTGPDNTGSNNDFSDAVYITSSVGCSNPNSIVLMPNGIMFQSDKGIWLLGRDLSTNYIGAPVEAFNSQTIDSATAIPGTNQVRFILDNKITLMYDYYFNQWGTFTNISAISATLYQGLHTYLNSFGQVFQEAPGTFLDGPNPVLMSFTTSWINVAGLQGYERFYAANLLGTYFSPFKLNCQIAYDYNSSPSQATIITPDNQSQLWGGEAQWGSGGAWGGGPGNVFSARLFPQVQKTEAFQMTMTEVYDASFNQPAGQGLSLSGLLLLVGVKRGSRTQKASRSFG